MKTKEAITKMTLTPKRQTYGQIWYHRMRPLYLKMGWTEETKEYENTIICKLSPPKGWIEKPILIICCKDAERFNPKNWKKEE